MKKEAVRDDKKNTVNETERMVTQTPTPPPPTRVFAIHAHWFGRRGQTRNMRCSGGGPKGFTAPFCKIDFDVGGKVLACMSGGWIRRAGMRVNPRDCSARRSFLPCTFDSQGNKVAPAEYGIENEAMTMRTTWLFLRIWKTADETHLHGNEVWKRTKNSGQVEGWNQIRDKVARCYEARQEK